MIKAARGEEQKSNIVHEHCVRVDVHLGLVGLERSCRGWSRQQVPHLRSRRRQQCHSHRDSHSARTRFHHGRAILARRLLLGRGRQCQVCQVLQGRHRVRRRHERLVATPRWQDNRHRMGARLDPFGY